MYKRKLCRIFVPIFLNVYFAISIGGHTAAAGEAIKTYVVKNVIDGDTIELANGRKVRYIGINTPETMERFGRTWVFSPEKFGTQAKAVNKGLVFHKKVRLEFDKEKEDRYGRWLAYVYTSGGKMVNLELVRKGFATVYTFPPNVKYLGPLLEAQEYAREKSLGLWGTIETISSEEAGGHIDEFIIVRGVVRDILFSKKMIFFDFYPDKTESFHAVIPARNVYLFDENGVDIYGFKGKNVEVFGKIEDKNGPSIRIDNPTQIEMHNQ